MASPNIGGIALDAAAVGAAGDAGAVASSPATATSSRPDTSSTVRMFWVRADSRSPNRLMAVSTTTVSAA